MPLFFILSCESVGNVRQPFSFAPQWVDWWYCFFVMLLGELNRPWSPVQVWYWTAIAVRWNWHGHKGLFEYVQMSECPTSGLFSPKDCPSLERVGFGLSHPGRDVRMLLFLICFWFRHCFVGDMTCVDRKTNINKCSMASVSFIKIFYYSDHQRILRSQIQSWFQAHISPQCGH